MKRIYQTVLLALALKFGVAQTAFWTPTTYKGAFDCNAAMWTNTWTEWDPQNKTYPAPTMTVSSNITSNTTWATGQTVFLAGPTYVKNNSILTIQPGVVILCSKAVAGTGLFITTGSQLQAVGTVSAPIVFTSDQAPGSRSQGDWGGVILMGLATNNNPGNINNIEGIAPSADTQYGGTNDNDNSGTLKYVRIEFPGYVYAVNKEINGLTLGAVGAATSLDYIQVSFSNDDSFEWFGGSVNAKHLIAYRGLDDDFDTDNGFHGNVQFGLGVRDPNIADNPAVSTSEGFESDNDPTGSTTTPITSAVFSNMTVIGPLRGSTSNTVAVGYKRGARIRRNSQLKIHNSILMDHLHGVHIDAALCEGNATAGTLQFANSICAGNLTGYATEHNAASTFNTPLWFGTGNPVMKNDSLLTTAGILVTPYNYLAPDYRPVCTNTMVNSGASFTSTAFTSGGVQGIKEVSITNSLKQMQLFPNPANEKAALVITTEKGFDVSVSIYNVTGQLISAPFNNYKLENGYNLLPVSLSNISNGIYFVTVSSSENKETIKLIVNK